MKRQILYLLAAALLLPLCAEKTSAQSPEKVTSIEGITEYKLDNGVQILLFPDKSKPQFTINMTIEVGSRHEGYGETGMAHLLEHMLFRGTEKYPDSPKWLKDRGVLNMNGTTWLDRTNYYETLPASDENLEFAIDFESDRLVNSTILGEHLAAEMTVVRNEFERGENSPQRILMQRITSNAFEWHNYGKSTIGNRSDIERVPIGNLRDFYRKFYQPDNVMVVVAGNFNEQKALDLLQKYFGALKVPDRKLPATYTEEPPQDGEREVVLRRVGDVQMAGVAYHIPAASADDYAAVEVLMNILGDEPSGPLYKKLVETEIASNSGAFGFKTHDPGLMYAMAEVPKDGDLEKAKTTLLETIQSAAEGFTDTDVKRAIRDIMKGRDRSFANTESFAINLSEWHAYGDWRLYFLHRDRLEKVTLADVKAAAAKYLKTDNRTVGLFIPTDEPDRVEMPEPVDIAAKLEGYKGRAAIAKGEAFKASPAEIDARTIVDTAGEGVKIALLPKKTRGERVFLSGQLHYGNENSLRGRVAAARMLPRLMARGTKNLDFQGYQDRLDEIETTLNLGGDVGQLSFSIETKKARMGEALGLLKEVLREPILAGEEMEVLRRQGMTALETSLSEPLDLARVKLQQTLSPYEKNDVRYVKTIAEQIETLKAVKVEEVQSLYNEFFGGQHVEIAIVGDFDADEVKPQIASIFEGWTSEQPYERIASKHIDVKPQRLSIDTPDKANAVYIAAQPLQMTDEDPRYEAMLVGDYILGGGPLSSRLANEVRKNKGLSYGVQSVFQAGAQDDKAAMMAFAISNPMNTEKVVDTIKAEIDRLVTSGVEQKEFDKARKSFLRTRRGGRAREAALAGSLRRNLELGRTMAFAEDSDQRIESLTKDQVDAALKELVDTEKMIIVTAGDFSKVQEGDSEGEQAKPVPAGAGN